MSRYTTLLIFPALIAILFVFAEASSAQPADLPDEESTTEIEMPLTETQPEPPPPPVLPEPEPGQEEEVYPPPPPPPHFELGEGIPLVEAGWGHMKIMGVMQALLIAPDLGNEEESRDIEFTLKRMRIILAGGFLDDKIGYHVEGDMVNMEGFLLEAIAVLRPLKAMEIRFGRLLPDFTYFMPRNVGKLITIDYPLVTSSFAPWNQVGLELKYEHEYFDIVAGIFNGMRFESETTTNSAGEEVTISSHELAEGYGSATLDNMTDDNLGKDLLFGFIVKPMKGLEVGGYLWYGMPQYHWYDVSSGDVKDDLASLLHAGIEARYLHEEFSVLAEYSMRRIYYPGSTDVRPDPLVGHGGYLHIGYRFIRMLEVMLRGDYFDADMDSDLGQEIWGTLGFNWYIDELPSRLTLEYILKTKERDRNIAEAGVQHEYYFDHGLYFQLCLMI